MIRVKRQTSLCILLALSLILSGIPFPGSVNTVSATEATTEIPSDPQQIVAIDENWDEEPASEIVDGTTGAGYTWSLTNVVDGAICVAPKSEVIDECQDETDMCLKISHPEYSSGPSFKMKLNNALSMEGSGYIVLNMDIAMMGEGNFTRFRLFTYNTAGNKNLSRAYIITPNTGFMDVDNDENSSTKINKNQFYNVKYVIDKSKGSYSLYIDGKVFVENKDLYNKNEVADLGQIHFDLNNQNVSTATDAQFYMDNLKIYSTTDINPSDIIIDETWNESKLGTIENNTSTVDYTWTVADSVINKQAIKVVKRTDVFGDGDANDKCVEISHVNVSETPSYYLTTKREIALGAGNKGYAVVKFDLAIKGEDNFERVIFYTKGTSAKITRGNLMKTTYYDNKTRKGPSLSKDVFHSFMYIIDKEASTYSLFVDEKVVAINQDFESTATHLNRFQLDNDQGYNTDKNAMLYLDNVKIYSIMEDPTPKKDLSSAEVTLSTSVTCGMQPTVESVKLDGISLSAETDYTVTVDTTAQIVTITGKGLYKGTTEQSYEIKHVSDEDTGYCTECDKLLGKVAFPAKNLTLGDDIAVNFYLEFAETVNKNNVRVEFTLANGKEQTVYYSEGLLYNDKDNQYSGKSLYCFSCPVFATEMDQKITACVYEEGDTEPIATNTYSVKEYNTELQGKEDPKFEEAKALSSAMITYGDMAKDYFDNTANAVTPEGLTAPDDSVLSDSNVKTVTAGEAYDKDMLSVKGMTLVLYAKTTLRIGLNLGTGNTLNAYNYQVSSKEADATAYENNNLAYETGNYDGVDYVDIPEINPADYDKVYKVVVTTKDTQKEVMTIEYSPFAYIKNIYAKNQLGTKAGNLVAALYHYNRAAEAYTSN